MSILQLVTLVCDGTDCDMTFVPAFEDRRDQAAQRRHAAFNGWVVGHEPGGRDMCPFCVAKSNTYRESETT